jgi:hypothetical protein
VRAVPAVLVTALLLAGCGTDERDELRALVEGITLEANDGDADGVRRGTEDLLARLDDAVASGALSSDEAALLRDRAQALRAGADEIDPRVLAAREAERRAAEAEARLEAERRAAQEEADRRAAEQAAAEEAARRQAEDAARPEPKGKRGKDDDEDDDD